MDLFCPEDSRKVTEAPTGGAQIVGKEAWEQVVDKFKEQLEDKEQAVIVRWWVLEVEGRRSKVQSKEEGTRR